MSLERAWREAKEGAGGSLCFDQAMTEAHESALAFGFGPGVSLQQYLEQRSSAEALRLQSPGGNEVGHSRIALWQAPSARITNVDDEEAACRIIVSGKLFSTEDGTFATAIGDILTAIRSGREWPLRRLGGLFVAIVWCLREGELVVITDRLGVMPFFLCEVGGLIFGGSHALILADLIGLQKRAHMGAVSQYLLFGYNATSSSLVDGVRRLPPAATLRWRPGRRLDTRSYAAPIDTKAEIGNRMMAERVHDVVSKSYAHWTRGESSMVIGLSGGFDSRYLAALAVSQPAQRQRFITIATDSSELLNARATASALNLHHEITPVKGSLWDAYAPESIVHIRPDGFPVTKSVCRLVARQAAGWPMVDGYLGDALIRGHLDHLGASKTGALPSMLLDPILESMEQAVIKRLAPRHHAVFRDHAFAEARAMQQSAGAGLRAITFADLFLRQRRYIDNNFLQNFPRNPPILPFYDPSLIQLKIDYPLSEFGRVTYTHLFDHAYPSLSGIPHSADLVPTRRAAQPSRLYKKLSRRLLMAVLTSSRSPVLDHNVLFPRLLRDALYPADQYITRAVSALVLLECMCDVRNIMLDWSFNGQVMRH